MHIFDPLAINALGMTLSEPLSPDVGKRGAKDKQLHEKNKIYFTPIILETI